MPRLYNYETGREVFGDFTPELIEESNKAPPTGAVYALYTYRTGVWSYLPAHALPSRTSGHEEAWKIARVYVMP